MKKYLIACSLLLTSCSSMMNSGSRPDMDMSGASGTGQGMQTMVVGTNTGH
ncbi:hypothetical protein [Glaciimonas immobilis]|uniref:Lipoprotein n=1 Tax=Glaciimonas immobilis TaxID=728004 RepID=A0A840RW42_9BURK|nr:hypothetical protein [Glaciimonas immobilis]KAF3996756.1 hypothetical protein HAV38_16985 [Glaciimonas immobilis]MBB5201318.1 hypothetical protein [Glaciimonas immobilis]